MRSELKIGLIVGVLLAAGLIIYMVNQDQPVNDSAPDITLPVDEDSQLPDEVEPDTATAVVDELPDDFTEISVASDQPVEQPAQPPQPEAPDAQVDLTKPEAQLIPAIKEKPKPVAPTVVPDPVDTPSEPDIPDARYYTVKKGDNLYRISELYFGEGRFWKIILDANKDIITNPDVVQEGWKLRIPYPEEVADNQ